MRPKSFAGLFGAAPSIALATLGLTISQHGRQYAAIGSSLHDLGSFSLFLIYSVCVCAVLTRHKTAALPTAIFLMSSLVLESRWDFGTGGEGSADMIKMDFASLKETKPHEYALRFLFGGICTVLAVVIAKRYGPGFGGLFLAFLPSFQPAPV